MGGMNQRRIILVVPDIRSIHNVGSLLRTADGLGVEKVYLCGYTPHPAYESDPRLPHIARKQTTQIAKTALGAERSDIWEYQHDVVKVIDDLHREEFQIVGLEQASHAQQLPDFTPESMVAIVLGREVEGIDEDLQKLCDVLVEIPMYGKKESFNVVEAATMALYHCRF